MVGIWWKEFSGENDTVQVCSVWGRSASQTGDCVSGSQLNGRLPKAQGSLTSNIISQSIRQITPRLSTPKEIQGSGEV